jgi:tetratricopeptide (TPR) repeat protein
MEPRALLPARLRQVLRRRRSEPSPAPGVVPEWDEVAAEARNASRAGDWKLATSRWLGLVDRFADQTPEEGYVEAARALRRCGRWHEAADLLQLGVQDHPAWRRLVIEDARTVLRLYERSAEDERHGWKARLLDAERRLAEVRAEGRSTPRTLMAHGQVLVALRRWDAAVEIWGELGSSSPESRAVATLRRAEAQRLAGDLAAARALLDEVPAEARDDGYARERQLLTRRRGVWLADELVAHTYARLELGERVSLEEVLAPAIELRGWPSDRFPQLAPLARDLVTLFETTGTPPPPQDAERPVETEVPKFTTVFVAGFLYSGSGVVFDHLREQAGVGLPFGSRETGFLKKANHFGELAAAPADGPRLVRAILSNVMGFEQTGRSLLGFFRGEPGFEAAVGRTRELLSTWRLHLRDGPIAVEPLTHSIQAFLLENIAARAGDSRVLTINNAVIAHQLGYLRLVPGARAVAVFRDPRDQYVSQMLESPNALELEPFVEMMAHRYEAFERTLADSGLAARIVPVRFEEYVLDEGSRHRTLTRLGLEGPIEAGPVGDFRPDVSARNIGIHESHLTDAHRRVLEAGLLERYHALSTARWP